MYPNPQDVLPLPSRPSLEQYKKRAKELVKACTSKNQGALSGWITNWIETLARLAKPKIALPTIRDTNLAGQLEQFVRSKMGESKLSLSHAQFVLARTHGFESWPKFAKHLAAISRANSPISAYEDAADAIVAGDLPTLRKLLRENPGVARLRSTREHQATLLIYVAANGVENYRQRTPRNIVVITELLLEAGADVNAAANIYGGHSTTLGLVATSVHPERAGVQEALMDLLLRRGAPVEGAVAPTYTRGLLVNACLANGRGRAAAYLAACGAQLDLEGAAGVGRLDVVKSFFNSRGRLIPDTTQSQLERALMWASEYGRNDVIEFLLEKGAPINSTGQDSKESTGQTALHWAIIGGQLDTITLLLARGASLETRNIYGSDALGQALWSAVHDASGVDHIRTINLLLEAGAKIEDGALGWIAKQTDASPALKSRLTEVLRRHGAKL
ncbi:MAG: ankyrin repeat domain-containing protein [Candidatus Sulfotelmatobacter sp.]